RHQAHDPPEAQNDAGLAGLDQGDAVEHQPDQEDRDDRDAGPAAPAAEQAVAELAQAPRQRVQIPPGTVAAPVVARGITLAAAGFVPCHYSLPRCRQHCRHSYLLGFTESAARDDRFWRVAENDRFRTRHDRTWRSD